MLSSQKIPISNSISFSFFLEFQQLYRAIAYDEEEDEQQEYNNGLKDRREGLVKRGIDEEYRAQQDRDIDETGEAGEHSQDEQDTTEEVGECHIVAHQHGAEGTKGHAVGDQVEHRAHVHEEVNAFIAEEGAEEDAHYIEPLGMMGVTPVFYTLYEVHIASFLGDGKSYLY
jgi:hypothetical protein